MSTTLSQKPQWNSSFPWCICYFQSALSQFHSDQTWIVIAAVLLGGTSFKGGSGTIVGTILGILILKVIDNGIILMGISQEFQLVVPGVILIIAVYFDNLRKAQDV